MEVIQAYKDLARNDTFELFMPKSMFSLSKDLAEIRSFLADCQKGTNLSSRIELYSLRQTVREVEKNINSYAGLNIKIAIYNANTNIQLQTIKSGYTTNLAFLHYVNSTNEWLLYAFARGRFMGSYLKIKKESANGCYIYLSVNQRIKKVKNTEPKQNI